MENNKEFDPVARMRHEIEHSKETVMLSRDGKMVGKIVNRHSYRCQMKGCLGWRICVKWPDGHHTYPCECGCRSIDKNTLQII